jgi:hypothetical protein
MLVLASVPLWYILALIAYAGAARLRLGYWPSYGLPDPADLNWPTAHRVVEWAFNLCLLALPACLIVAVVAWWRRSDDWRVPLWGLVAFGIAVGWFLADPGGFLEWYAD